MPPFVERIQVEDGFLSGMDLHFAPGLNVIIGPRGVGKTSIIELLRLCLGVAAISEEFDERSREHAQSILGADGRVVVTLRDGDRKVLVSRRADDESARRSRDFQAPRIFSQAEIERVGLEAQGRLRIIDEFANVETENTREETSLEASIRSFTVQIRQLTQDLAATREQIESLTTVPDELRMATELQASVLRTVKQSANQQKRLAVLNTEVATASVRTKQVDKAIVEIDVWRKEILAVARRVPRLAEWPSSAGPNDLLAPVRQRLRQALKVFEDGVEEVANLHRQAEGIRRESQASALALEEEARKLRSELEKLKAGAGTAAQKVAVLQERVSQLEALKSHADELAARMSDAGTQRRELVLQLQELRDRRYSFRSNIARSLSRELGPAIQVVVEQGGDTPGYVGAIQAAIRGSGLHHSTLAPQLARAMSPRELIEAIEKGDAASIAGLSGISEERANKVIEAIGRSGAEEIITAPINDRVIMKLLDGQEYKPTTELSTGQRCTVVLSVLLGSEGRGLVIDQPEDHLDNAFIVKTLIGAIQRRKETTQLIFTTHNANIPVLADADLVALLGSDGQRGFVKHSGPLSDPEIVRAITSVMEGGYEAFERRAEFYRTSFRQPQR